MKGHKLLAIIGITLLLSLSAYAYSNTPSNSAKAHTRILPPMTRVPVTNCDLQVGGNNQINLIFYGPEDKVKGYEQFVMKTLKQTTPYKEFTYNVYIEKNKGDCKVPGKTDVEIGLEYFDIFKYGVTYGTNPPNIQINLDNWEQSKDWSFLILHELGHANGIWWHTNDGSMMDANGGNAKYTQEEINIIRSNLWALNG